MLGSFVTAVEFAACGTAPRGAVLDGDSPAGEFAVLPFGGFDAVHHHAHLRSLRRDFEGIPAPTGVWERR